MASRRLQQHVGAFRDLREQGGPTTEEQELLAAKLIGRWRSCAPGDPSLADEPQRNNDFNYATMDPKGYAVPLGSHIRRMNARDTTVGNVQRCKIIRRGAAYGPGLPEGAAEDGVDRGIKRCS
jgi:deferrochelatase/peroxidase EfeB